MQGIRIREVRQERVRWVASASDDSRVYDDTLQVGYTESPWTEEEADRLIVYYGMPPESDIRRVKHQGDELAERWGERWRGFQANGVGIVVPHAVPPFCLVGGLILQLYELQIGRFDTPLYLRMRWYPKGGEYIGVAGLEHKHTAQDLKRIHAALPLLRKISHSTGRPALLTTEEKRLVLAEVIRLAEEDGTPRERLALKNAADCLSELCEGSHPVEIAGHLIVLPPSLEDHELDNNTQRNAERVRQWLEDIFGHRRWSEARLKL